MTVGVCRFQMRAARGLLGLKTRQSSARPSSRSFPLDANVEKRADQLVRSVQIEHRMDARSGAALLLAGFVLQVIGNLGTATL